MVFLLGAPLKNRSIVAQRLTRNRHLLVSQGTPVALEFDECVPEHLRALIRAGTPLSDAQIDEMTDAVIVRVQQVADERPVIFSAFLPIRRLRQRFFNAFDDKTIIRLVVTSDDNDPRQLTPRGSDRLSRLSSTANTFSVAALEEPPSSSDLSAAVVAVPEIDDQFDQTWRSDDAELGLEALAMLDKAADDELRRRPERASDALARTRKRLALAWLNGQFEEIAPEHHRVDATRTLHEVAREVRQHVQSNVVRCSNRQRSLTRDQSASMIVAHRWGDVGGTRGIATIFLAGALAGAALGAMRKSWW